MTEGGRGQRERERDRGTEGQRERERTESSHVECLLLREPQLVSMVTQLLVQVHSQHFE